jgi:hypothetical protein
MVNATFFWRKKPEGRSHAIQAFDADPGVPGGETRSFGTNGGDDIVDHRQEFLR